MLASKSSAFSNKRKGPCSNGDSSISDVWSLLSENIASYLRRSVVSLVLTDEYGFHSALSGIAIECQDDVTKFVTTGILASALLRGHYKQEIEVYCEGNVVTGHLYEYDSSRQLAVVKVECALDVQCVRLNRGMECRPCKQLIAVGRHFDRLIAVRGEISYGSKDREFLIFPHISKNWLGAAFFDINGEFVGMNHCLMMPSKIFLERSKSREVFHYVGMNGSYEFTRDSNGLKEKFLPLAYDVFEKERFPDLCALGYPIPSRSMVNRGMILVNTFECPFGDVYPKGVWGKFRKRVSSEITRNVVALASFKGDTRFFACTGIFIDFDGKHQILTSASLVRDPDDQNKIIKDFRIKVLLPGKRCEIGKLELHSLRYNVALVSVHKYRALCPVNLERLPVNLTNDMIHDCMVNDTTVVAIGRTFQSGTFQSGTLMAASGKLTTDALRKLDCEALSYSTCKITKVAGIGGPLVDIDGNFIGMNFHGMCFNEIGTPYLYREDLSAILKFLKTKETKKFYWGGSILGDEESKKRMNKWPVPDPYWCDSSDMEEDQMNEKREVRSDSCPMLGSKRVLK
ncbi:unnamed protein product [Urochloa decumbens]|uniref:Uncharacterized protein n=1 Tax=Urochloa decumbens TaxID=240449 RepID=A0ABC9FG94_9POAL